MKGFRDVAEFRRVFERIFELVNETPEVGRKLRDAHAPHRLLITDLGLEFNVTGAPDGDEAKGRFLRWTWGPADWEPVVTMRMARDVANRFFQGKESVPLALALGRVKLSGCGLTPEWTRETVAARRKAGEEVWWYICCAPKAPYATEFIDHPGTELRLWPWQSWQYGVSGILIWATVYWTSPLGYPEPTLQDPWQDPMSWVSGYGFPVGHRSPWGNGDGRFLYPPRRDPNLATAPCLDAPINSLRWENLRDGMEDYEYLWLLDQTVREAAARGVMDADGMARARQLLEVPPAISQDLTHFTTDPRPILRHRSVRRSRIDVNRMPSASGGPGQRRWPARGPS